MDEKGKKRVNGWVEDTDGVNFGSGGFRKEGLTRCCRTFSVELNMAEPLIMSAEYGRLEMVKLIVKVSRWCHIAGGRQKGKYLQLSVYLSQGWNTALIRSCSLPYGLL